MYPLAHSNTLNQDFTECILRKESFSPSMTENAILIES
jgi:hypothetical protein